MTLAVIVCEGFDDRAFLKGLLIRRLGCRIPDKARLKGFADAAGAMGAGHFAFLAPGDRQIRVAPAHGGGRKLKAAVQDWIKKPETDVVLMVVDSDATAGGPETAAQFIAGAAESAGLEPEGHGDWYVGAGTRLGGIVWAAPEPGIEELPNKQTLERLVCAAIRAVHPKRATNVADWLRSEPAGAWGHKNHAMAHLAKWFAHELTTELGFYEHIWADAALADALQQRLTQTGDWSRLRHAVLGETA